MTVAESRKGRGGAVGGGRTVHSACVLCNHANLMINVYPPFLLTLLAGFTVHVCMYVCMYVSMYVYIFIFNIHQSLVFAWLDRHGYTFWLL